MIYFMNEYGDWISGTPNHSGEKFPKENVRDVFMVQADGDELAQCCIVLNKVTTKNRAVYTFVGVEAQIIAANFK